LWYGLVVDISLREPFLDEVAAIYAEVRPVLDERQRRLVLGSAARRLGRGGIKRVAAAVGVDPETVSRGVKEIQAGPVVDGRVRVAGAGRPPITETAPGVAEELEHLVEPVTRGDPQSPLRWTNKSTQKLADELTVRGFAVGPRTVAKLLKTCGYRLQANAKVVEGRQHPDRDAQFEYVNAQAVAFLAAGDPVISVDTKKRELVGDFKNAGREWEPVGEPAEVNVHDFPGDAVGVALPYGVYDLGANTGWVNVGTDHDTACFAVESIRRWWRHVGADAYPTANRLLVTADGGGSNGSRLRLWKAELARFADETGLAVTVVHLPPGTSKWNKSVWPLAATPGAMKCGGVRAARRVPVGRGRRLDLGVCEPETSLARGPEGPGSVAASTNPRFFSDLVPPRRVDLDPRRSGGTDP
jgi:hypothetical protein